jgi:hypothetical protein
LRSPRSATRPTFFDDKHLHFWTIIDTFGQDSDLRRHGEKIASRGGKNSKKRAAVAVARKLSVLLHRLWVTGEVYDPLYNTHRRQKEEKKAA